MGRAGATRSVPHGRSRHGAVRVSSSRGSATGLLAAVVLAAVATCGGCRSEQPFPDAAQGTSRDGSQGDSEVAPEVATRAASQVSRPGAAPAGQPRAGMPAGAEPDCFVIVDCDSDFGSPPLTVHFQTEIDCTSSPVTYAWDFGDGGKAGNVTNPTHTYEMMGDFVATVRVTSPDGAESDDEIDVTVDPMFAE